MSLAIRIALDNNKFEAAELLYDNGANIMKTWVIRSVIEEDYPKISFFLKCYRDFPDILNIIIGMAIETRDLKILIFIVNEIGLIEINSFLRFSLLRKVVSIGSIRMIEFLLGKDVEVPSDILMDAISRQYARFVFEENWGVPYDRSMVDWGEEEDLAGTFIADIVKMLCNKGADPNFVSNNGKTPLLLAIETNYPQVFEVLIEEGADINWKDNNGESLIELSLEMKSKSIHKILKNIERREMENEEDNSW